MYSIENKIVSKSSWFTPAESNNYYRTRYAREGITIHWWGDGTGADNHDNIVNYITAQAQQGVKSVNYVLSDNKISMLVDADNVAWCSQAGNPTTISIECQPTLGEEGYRKLGWLVNELEQRYGHGLTLYPHSHWYNTSCPGTLDLGKIRDVANKWKSGQEDEEMITKDDIGVLRIGHSEIGGWDVNKTHAGEYDGTFLAAWQGKSVKDFIWAQWNAGGAFRNERVKDMAAYPQLSQAVLDLQVQLKDAQNKPPVEVIKTVQQIVEKCTVPPATQPVDPTAPKPESTASWLIKLIARLKKK
jgi:hypothetical protein